VRRQFARLHQTLLLADTGVEDAASARLFDRRIAEFYEIPAIHAILVSGVLRCINKYSSSLPPVPQKW